MIDDNDDKSIFEKVTDTVKDAAGTALEAAKQTVGPATGERSVAATAGEGAVTDPTPLSTATMPRNPRPAPATSSRKAPKRAAKRTTRTGPKNAGGTAKKTAKKSAPKKSGARKSAVKASPRKAGKKAASKGAKKSVKKAKSASKTSKKRSAGAVSKKRKGKKSKR